MTRKSTKPRAGQATRKPTEPGAGQPTRKPTPRAVNELSKKEIHPSVEKLRTGISSLDIIAKGGLPKGRTTLISGTAGSGKTVFGVHSTRT